MDIIGMLKAGFEAGNRLMRRLWGDQTKEQDSLEAQADHAATEKQAALDRGDLAGANHWGGELKRLHREIAAKRG